MSEPTMTCCVQNSNLRVDFLQFLFCVACESYQLHNGKRLLNVDEPIKGGNVGGWVYYYNSEV